MAKTIMISDETYDKLKTIKKDRSFSKTILALIDISAKKTGADLFKHLGVLRDEENEYESIEKELKKSYKKWDRRYV